MDKINKLIHALLALIKTTWGIFSSYIRNFNKEFGSKTMRRKGNFKYTVDDEAVPHTLKDLVSISSLLSFVF
jgi:hypothetical protein